MSMVALLMKKINNLQAVCGLILYGLTTKSNDTLNCLMHYKASRKSLTEAHSA
jgi:hypothetical protein